MKYIAAQFEANGLAPAGDNGTYYQRVPLIGISTDFANTSLAFTKDGANVLGPLKDHEQFVGQNKTQVANDAIDSDVVFVGHGVEAPEYKWDDYKGLDTRGKTLVILVDDPPASASEHSPERSATHARWIATSEDEHAVSIAMFGPLRPSQYESRPTIALGALPSSQ